MPMPYKRKILSLSLALAAAIPCILPAHALQNVSHWAQQEITLAASQALEPAALQKLSATENITREEFCQIILQLYITLTGQAPEESTQTPFTDTKNPAVATAYALGLVSGKTDTAFAPKSPINRQELCKMLDNVLLAANYTITPPDEDVLDSFSDRMQLESWAQPSMAHMIESGIIRGTSTFTEDATGERTELTLLSPRGTTTREQALLVALRFVETFKDAAQDAAQTPPTNTVSITAPTEAAGIPDSLLIADPEGADSYVSKQDTPVDTDANIPMISHEGIPDALPQTEEEKMAYVFGTAGYYFATPEEAEAAMTEIEIPVWRLQGDGSKKSGKAYVVVNANLAPIYQAVFEEIYNGAEQFPIADIGSYAWRASETSEHRWGTAIDINADANMECSIDENGEVTAITCGTHWTPNEDPLSICEDGDVYRAFTKYGFSWGGNAWRGKRDYMHFSYFGR